MTTDQLVLTINGQQYSGWESVSVTREIDRMCAAFDLSVSERWLGRTIAWPITPWSTCTIAIADQTILTGYVDAYDPSFSATSHKVSVRGRSKTEDIVDCGPELAGGQFRGYSLEAIARAVCQPFGIEVVVDVATGDAFEDATIERAETAYEFLERLCRLRGVLACDDGHGRLVLTHAGARTVSGVTLAEGVNILSGSARLDVSRRFSKYIVRTQKGMTAESEEVETDQIGSATDAGCPRYRPHVGMGESALTLAQTQARAHWQAVYNTGRSLEASIKVQGWRKPDGTLWAINEQIYLLSPKLGIDRDMLVAGVTWSRSNAGTFTDLRLGPVEGYTPDPGQIRYRKGKHCIDTWGGVASIK